MAGAQGRTVASLATEGESPGPPKDGGGGDTPRVPTAEGATWAWSLWSPRGGQGLHKPQQAHSVHYRVREGVHLWELHECLLFVTPPEKKLQDASLRTPADPAGQAPVPPAWALPLLNRCRLLAQEVSHTPGPHPTPCAASSLVKRRKSVSLSGSHSLHHHRFSRGLSSPAPHDRRLALQDETAPRVPILAATTMTLSYQHCAHCPLVLTCPCNLGLPHPP